MSFTMDIKQELLQASEDMESCCAEALLYGMLLFGHNFSSRVVRLRTEFHPLAEFLYNLLRELLDVTADIGKIGQKWEVGVIDREDRKRILAYFGHAENELSLQIARENFVCDACRAAFLRGVFLACGAVSAPKRQYYLEFYVGFKRLAGHLVESIKEMDILPKICQRNGTWVVYHKDSNQIEDFLGHIGARLGMLEIVVTKIEKDIRNNVNRAFNFEMANTDRVSLAAAEQLHAIRELRESAEFSSLSKALQEAALLREAHPEASLQELCSCAECTISRSGMNHRLQKLVLISEELRKK